MKIYELHIDTGKKDDNLQYQLASTEKSFLNEFEKYVDGIERIEDKLSNLKLQVIRGKRQADFAMLWNGSCLYLVNKKAKVILDPLVNGAAEFISMDNELYLLHVLCAADALDIENIEANKYNNMIGYIKKFAFKSEEIPDSEIFRVTCESRIYTSAIFVTDRFKKVVEENSLIGFKFKEIGDY